MNRRAPALSSLMAALVPLLSACNGSQPIAPSALLPVGSVAASPSPVAPEPTASGSASVGASPVSLSATRVMLAPIVGSTARIVAPLSERLAARATESGYRIAPRDDPAAPPPTHVLKGYLSAFDEGGETTVVYVWDVLDPMGNRLHRIQGQEKSPAIGSGADAWASVPSATIRTIADRTVAELTAYLAKPPG